MRFRRGLLLAFGWLIVAFLLLRFSFPRTRAPLVERPAVTSPGLVTLNDGTFTYRLNLTQFQAEWPHLQNYNCSLQKAAKDFCRQHQQKPLLLLAVKSHPLSADRRAALRQTWAAEREVSGYWVKTLFLMATTTDLEPMNLATAEAKEYNDILLWDFTESHHNLSLKERCFIEWLHHSCKEAEFIFKGDDDVFVNPAALARYVKRFAHATHMLHGYLQRHAAVLRVGKYAVTETLYTFSKYPAFLSGGGFIVPGPAISDLYQASTFLPVYPLDDVYLGFLGLAANVEYQHSNLIYVYGLKYDICLYEEALMVHDVSPQQLVEIWQDMQAKKCQRA